MNFLPRIFSHKFPLLLSLLAHLGFFALFLLFNRGLSLEKKPEVFVNIISFEESFDSVKKQPLIKEKIGDGEKKSVQKKSMVKEISYVKDVDIRPTNNPAPPYPRVAKVRKYQGKVELRLICDAKGEVVSGEIYRSSGYEILDEAALKTVKKWRFDIDAGEVGLSKFYRIIVPVEFVLQ